MGQRIRIELVVDDSGTAVVNRVASTIEQKMAQAARNAGGSFQILGNQFSGTLDRLSTRVVQFGSLFAGIGAGLAVKGGMSFGAEFEKQMSAVSAVSGATGTALKRLGDQALQLGPKFGFSAIEAGKAQENLALAGFNTNEVLKLLPDTMTLARAGALGLADSATIASDVLRGFGMGVEDFQTVVDQLAYAASYSNAEVSDLGESFKYVGAVASSIGARFSEVNAALAMLANQGIRGELAGTGLTRVMSVLLGKTEEGEKGLGSFNMKLFDSRGKFLGLANAILEMQKAGLTAQDVMEAFGQRGGPTMLRMMAGGAEATKKFEVNLKAATGTAEEMALVRMDNLAGDWGKLRGAAGELAVTLFQQLSPSLRSITQDLTKWIQDFSHFAKYSTFVSGLKDAFKLAAEAAGFLMARKIWIWAGSGITALKGMNAQLVWNAKTAQAAAQGLDSAGKATSFLGLNSAKSVTQVGFLAFAVGTLAYQATRALLEMTGLDQKIRDFFTHAMMGDEIDEATKRATEGTVHYLQRVFKAFPGISMKGIIDPAELTRLGQIEEKIRALRDMPRPTVVMDSLGEIIPTDDWKKWVGRKEEIAALEKEQTRLNELMDQSYQKLQPMAREVMRIKREYPEAWAEATATLGDFEAQLAFANELIGQQKKALLDKAKAEEEAAARRKQLTEEELKAQERATEDLRKSLAGIGIFTKGAAEAFETHWGRMTNAVAKEGTNIEDLVRANKKELLEYANGVERAGGTIAKGLEVPVEMARKLKATEDSITAWMEREAALDKATGISVEAVGNLAEAFDRLNKEAGQHNALVILKEEIIKLGEAAQLRGWNLGDWFTDLVRLAQGVKTFKEETEDANKAAEEWKKTLDELHQALAKVGVATSSMAKASAADLSKLWNAAQMEGVDQIAFVAAYREELYRLKDAYASLGEEAPPEMQSLFGDLWEGDQFAALQDKIQGLRDYWREFTREIVQATGDAFARSVVYGENFWDSMKAFGKQALANLISLLVQIGLQYLLAGKMGSLATAKQGAAGLAAGLAQVYVNSFFSAAAIPVTGWAMAPGIAAANLALAKAMALGAGGAGGAMGAGLGSMGGGAALAEGGIVTRPVRALIGEAGREAVLPLEGENARKVRRQLGVNDQATVIHTEVHQNFHGDNWRDGGVAPDLAEAVAVAIGALIQAGRLRPIPTEVR